MADEALTKEKSRSSVTVEQAAYAAVGLAAAGLRFFQLGLRPLNEAEAVQAMAAFRFTQGAAQTAPTGTIPALFTGNVAAFTLFGAGDASARWLPALAGMVLVLLPFWLRHRLGRGGALIASLLLALSPSAVFHSRALDGAIIVAACGLALVVAAINYADTRRPAFLYLAAVALGLGLCAGSAMITMALILAAFIALLYLTERLLDRETGWSSILVAWSALRGEKGLMTRFGVILAATYGLVATSFVLYPGGVGHAADLLADWARSFAPEAGGSPALYPVVLLPRYELLILVMGLVEVIAAALVWRGGRRASTQPGSVFPHTALLAFWAVASALVVLASGHRPTGNLLLVVVPLALLSGQGVERAWRWVSRRAMWPEIGVITSVALGLLVFSYLQIAGYSQAAPTSTVSVGGLSLYASTSYLLLAAIALLLLVGLGAVAWIWRGAGLLLAAGWLTCLVVLGLFGFRAMWAVSFAHAADPRELMIMATTAPDVRVLVERLEALSVAQAGDEHTLPLTVDAATGSVIAWYLRDFDRQEVVEGLSEPPDTLAAVTLAMQEPPIGETFRGRGFPLRMYWLPWGMWGQDLVRWLLYNDASLPVVDQEVVMWVASGE